MKNHQTDTSNTDIVFLIGCQRSGTTLLSDLLHRHPDMTSWQEPYFIWDWYGGDMDDDCRDASHVTDKLKALVKKEFSLFKKKGKAKILVEKSPENCFRIPFLLAVYPDAKFINIIRDGRDVTLSIQKEWQKRADFVNNRKFLDFFLFAIDILKEQPFWRNRFQQLWYELSKNFSLNPKRFLNKSRWKGFAGWGPRFPNWEKAIQEKDLLSFNAMQWAESVRYFEKSRTLIAAQNMIDVRYEDLLQKPQETLGKILAFLGQDTAPLAMMAEGIKQDNYNKWRTAYSAEEIAKIEAVQDTILQQLGYRTGEFENAA